MSANWVLQIRVRLQNVLVGRVGPTRTAITVPVAVSDEPLA